MPTNITAVYIAPITILRVFASPLHQTATKKNETSDASALGTGGQGWQEVENLHLGAYSPKDGAEQQRSEQSEEKSNQVVIWTAPIGQPLLPEASFELPYCGLRVLCREIKI
jgi:hypothetical protein